MANHREWPCCHIFFSLCIIPGTKQHLPGTTISSYRDLFSEWIKFIFQQKGGQLHNVLARILLLFPAFYLLLQHIQLPHHLWGTELSLKGCLIRHPAVALTLRPPTYHPFYTVGKHSLHLGWPSGLHQGRICASSLAGRVRLKPPSAAVSSATATHPDHMRHTWLTIFHSVSI